MADRAVAFRVLRAVVGLVLLGLAVNALVRNWDELSAQPVHWTLSPLPLAGAIAAVLGTYALLVEAWRRTLAALGDPLPYLVAARICLISNLGKYLPGKIWTVTGAAYMARQVGARSSNAFAAALLLQGYSVVTGFLVSVALGLPVLQGGATTWVLGWTVVVLLAGSAGLSWPPAARGLNRLLPEPYRNILPLPLGIQGTALAFNLAGWIGYGVGFFLLAQGISTDADLSLAAATSIFALAYVIGFVSLIAPGGLGVRESVVVLALTESQGAALALALAVASRLLMTLVDVIATAPLLFASKRLPPDSSAPPRR